MLIQYEDGTKTYILSPDGLKAGDKISIVIDKIGTLTNPVEMEPV